MIIAIDLDNTCIASKSWIHKFINKHINVVTHKRRVPYKFEMHQKQKFTIFNKLIGSLNSKKYYQIKDASSVINKLSESNTIILLSSRPVSLVGIKYLTKKNIEDLGINYDAIFINCTRKGEFCKNFGVDLFIDDSLYQCKQIRECVDIPTICFTDKNYQLDDDNIIVTNSWQNIYNYAQFIMPLKDRHNKCYLNSKKTNKIIHDYSNRVLSKSLKNIYDSKDFMEEIMSFDK